MSEPIIRVKNLRKVYRVGNEQVVALDNINFEVPIGQVCCIVGTSGSGKSTLLNQMAGLEKPSKGGVFIGNHNISTFSEDKLAKFRQKNIGFVFQSYNLMASMTALDNVTMPLIFRGVEKHRRTKAAKKILLEVGLGGRIHHTPSQMSGGQQQRVGIARAFVANPKIIFADEPTGNLDSKTTVEVMRMMIRLCHEHNQTLILVTHDPSLARYADRIITILDGNITSDQENRSIAFDETPEETAENASAEASVEAEETPSEEAVSEEAPPAVPAPESAEKPEPEEENEVVEE